MNRMAKTAPPIQVRRVVTLAQILAARELVDDVRIDPRLSEYIVALVQATRDPKRAGAPELENHIQLGCSPRASIWLAMTARANAFLEGRGYVTPGDIKRVAPSVLRHRVIPTYEADAEGIDSDALVARLCEIVPAP